MLVELRVRDLAIIESLSLPFARGFNVLSGETGAGKSIIVGALSLLTGERASAEVIRTGAERAVVEGVFDLSGRADLQALLDARGIECPEGLLVLKREVAAGRTRAWANGSPVTAGILASVGRVLVTIHGQHESQELLDAEAQRRILDAFAEARTAAMAVRDAYETVGRLGQAREHRARARAAASARAEWLRHVVDEVSAAELRDGELAEVDEEHRRLQHVAELRGGAAQAAALLDGDDDAVLARLAVMDRHLAALERMDPGLARVREMGEAAWYQLQELARELDAYAESVADDPERLATLDARRAQILRVSRKFGGTEAAALDQLAEARRELALLDDSDGEDARSEAEFATARARLAEQAAHLTALRGSAATRLANAVETLLPSLGLPDGRFQVALRALDAIGPDGAESVTFMVSLNVGHAARPLDRIASGGELSRIMLALQTILARRDGVPTLIFDEVDAGIGGSVGLQVGAMMHAVAQHHQVFAITHLAQIAARADHHLVVAKGARAGVTTADVGVVDADARVREVARMLGGDAESPVSQAHARELLAPARVAARDADLSAPRTARTRSR
mgnify:CR=1 FL=1